MESFYKGQGIRINFEFKNQAGVYTDPTTPKIAVMDPTGTVTTYTYPTSIAVVKVAVGRYYVDITVSKGGDWYAKASGTGGITTATEVQFRGIETKNT